MRPGAWWQHHQPVQTWALVAERDVRSRLWRAEFVLTDPFSKPRSQSEFDRWLVLTSREAIRRSRELLEQTKPLVPAPIKQRLAADIADAEKTCPTADEGLRRSSGDKGAG